MEFISSYVYQAWCICCCVPVADRSLVQRKHSRICLCRSPAKTSSSISGRPPSSMRRPPAHVTVLYSVPRDRGIRAPRLAGDWPGYLLCLVGCLGEWVSSFLTAHLHSIGYAVPYYYKKAQLTQRSARDSVGIVALPGESEYNTQHRLLAKFRENLNVQQFKVIQGRWFWYQSKAHVQIPISD